MRPSLPLCKGHQSSKQWLARQFRDPYVQRRMASPAHYRSRSAFKLLEMDTTYRFIDRPRTESSPYYLLPRVIVDLGAAPGGWSQVVALKCGYTSHVHPLQNEPSDMQYYGLSQGSKLERQGTWSDQVTPEVNYPRTNQPPLPKIIAVDLLRVLPIPGVSTIQADFLSPTATELIRGHLPKYVPDAGVDLLLSDMAANATGNSVADVANSLRICEAVVTFAEKHLSVRRKSDPGGTLVLKHFVHPHTQRFFKEYLVPSFKKVSYVKPASSRAESSESYWVCQGWLGGPAKQQRLQPQPPPLIPTEPFQLTCSLTPNPTVRSLATQLSPKLATKLKPEEEV